MATGGIQSALAKLEADTKGDRADGLDDLKRILHQDRSSSKANGTKALEDDHFHTIFELIYNIVAKQKPVFLRATKPTTRNNAASRLEVAAAALRLTVEVVTAQIRFKTAVSVLDHIIDTLPTADGSFCEPLQNDYLKSFKVILDHAPHGEHLRRKQWQNYVDFALSALSLGLEDDGLGDGVASSREIDSTSRNGRHLTVRVSQRSSRSSGKEAVPNAEDIGSALKSLTGLTNAPIMSRAAAIAETMLAFLNAAARAQDIAFEILNNVIFMSLTDDVAFTQTLVHRLVPIMRRSWSDKSILLREQMLVALFACRFFFLASSETWPLVDLPSFEPLLTTMISEYRTRSERDILHFDDMQPVSTGEASPLQLKQFKPLRNSARAMTGWMTLSVIACLVMGLSRRARPTISAGSAEEMPRKRKKVQSPFEETLHLASAGVGQEKVAALQIVLFIFDQPQSISHEEMQEISRLLPDLFHEDSNVQSWAFLVFSRLAVSGVTVVASMSDMWLRVWDAAQRALSIPGSARAASHTLNVLVRTGIVQETRTGAFIDNTLFAGTNNGPCSLTDTSLIMFTSILRITAFDDDRRLESFCTKVIGWLAARWTLPSNIDHLYTAHVAFHARPELLYSLLITICGVSEPIVHQDDWSPMVPQWKASLMLSPSLEFLHYLLRLRPSQRQDCDDTKHSVLQVDPAITARLCRAVLDLLSTRLTEFLRVLETIHAERSSNITSDMVEVLSVSSTLASAVWTRCGSVVNESAPHPFCFKSRETVVGLVLDQNDDTMRSMAIRVSDGVLRLYRQLVQDDFKASSEEFKSVIDSALGLARHGMTSNNAHDPLDVDFFDMDEWDSQASRRRHGELFLNIMRHDLPVCQDSMTLLAKYRVELVTALQTLKSHTALDPRTPSIVIEEIIQLDPISLLAARGAVRDFLDLKSGITRRDALRLLQSLGKMYLENEAFERCEAALCFCLTTMQSLTELWTSDEADDDLTTAAFDIYGWFLDFIRLASPRVLSVTADLLDLLLRKNASFGGEDFASPRTSLLKLLQVADVTTKYRMSGKLSRIFEKYILTQHEAIFDDIIENLPADPDSREGIAVRLHIVAGLGARWHTVLRQATYNLFETVANVPSATALASDCIVEVQEALHLQRPRQLFHLFSPQIFYTWLSNGTLSRMPFRAFGYTSLKELALDNIAELVSQIALRGFKHSEELSQLVGHDWNALLVEQFSNVEAYTLASETSLPKQDRLYDGSEKLVRKQLGSDRYLELLRTTLPDIIARLVICLQDDRGVDKAFEKSQQASAHESWLEMYRDLSQHSQLPFAQQPSFRAKCLPDELHYLYLRLDLQADEVWTPALLIHVYRQLLDRASPVLGPLHICSIIRKIRIVVSLAGPAALKGYPLEMILHHLRPYLTLFDCAEDTMAIYRYLLRHGKAHLATSSSFIAGLGVAIFASLTGFIGSSQDSTTQESHFLSTMTRAQEFRAFLGQYLESLNPSKGHEESLANFPPLVQHSKAISSAGNSGKSSSEGSLLYALLSDRNAEHPLLTDLHFDLAIEILCRNFSYSADPEDDILADDYDAARFSPILRTVIKRIQVNKSFHVWAAQVIGRGFVMRGLTFNNSDEHSAQYPTSALPASQDLGAVSSYTSIIEYLTQLLWKFDFAASTLAERTLQLVFSALDDRDEDAVLAPTLDREFVNELRFKQSLCPPISVSPVSNLEEESLAGRPQVWALSLLKEVCEGAANDPVLGFLKPLISMVPDAADALLPYVVHLVLLREINHTHQAFREHFSQEFSNVLRPEGGFSQRARQLVLKTLLYLQRCRVPGESNLTQRYSWLEIDLGEAAVAAADCQMWHEALQLLELHHSAIQLQSGRSSRRSFSTLNVVANEIVSKIYENVDDMDFFYGKHEVFDLHSVISKMSHEGASQKSLSFNSAMLDARSRMSRSERSLDTVAQSTAASLSAANMQGISDAVKHYYEGFDKARVNATSGDQWNLLPLDDSSAPWTNISHLFRSMHSIATKDMLSLEIDQSLFELVCSMKTEVFDKGQTSQVLSQLAVLGEAKQIISVATPERLESVWAAINSRNSETKLAEFDRLSPVLTGREAAFAAIRRNNNWHAAFSLNSQQALLHEIQVTRQSLDIASNYDEPQFCLNRAMYLSELELLATGAGLKVDVAIQFDLAKTLWAQNEVSACIGILQTLKDRDDTAKQAIIITRADILTDLGHKVADARLEKPDEIVASYLLPSFKELRGRATGSEPGRVFHNFAAFCDMQLQDADNLDDFTRISQIRDRKLREVHELNQMHQNSRDDKQRKQLMTHLHRAKTWFKLDEEEWKRVQENREDLIHKCLENYLLSMGASDDYPNDTLRFVALWLNQADSAESNKAVAKYLPSVPTIKFTPLVNQLSSRLLDVKDPFQHLLMDLMFRICSDHPYHSLYQVFAASKSKGSKGDDVAALRNAAANKLADLVNKKSVSAAIWVAIHNSCIALHRVASERLSDKEGKTGSKILLRKLSSGQKLEHVLSESHTKTPPPTLKIPLRPDRDYSGVPTFGQFEPQISIAGGVSAPKIATMIASDGSRHRMLLKGGNDDLRQDAIMEQVFEQVSDLLKGHRAPRQRNLGIRTYKVIPLTANTGIIEFVKDTIPLHEYLLPAHTRYCPKDYKPSRCRKEIADAQTKPLEQRIRAYRTVLANFHPVMRFFFMEHFPQPDDWFYKRLNYSRSTAAVSILGHVLGLGDRHGHNILLDENSGEVVHIDLGVAFEAGRVLPVPEVVPFRLTRDLVDGMGQTGVEGVFRRCCNLTLEALRHDQEAIMTILDVLRYDPLHSWSISPLRLQKMQENHEQAEDAATAASTATGASGAPLAGAGAAGVIAGRREANEPSEADRALTIVAKKLGKALSVEATVNELIRQATDERNLAVLYCGWAAYA